MTTTENKKMKDGFLSKILLMLLSFVIAILLWYLCTAQDQKVISRKFNDIPVVYINDSGLYEDRLTANVENNITVDIVLKGYNSAMKEINSADIMAVVDLALFKDVGLHKATPVISGIPEGITSSKVESVNVNIERIIDKSLYIDIEVKGVPKDGYTIDKNKIEYLNHINVSCSESYSKNITGAKVILDVTEKNEDYIVNLNVILIDQAGNEMDKSKVKMERDSVELIVHVDK